MLKAIRGSLFIAALLVALAAVPVASASRAQTSATGGTIRIMSSVSVNSPLQSYPEVDPTLRAGIAAINKKGGINGQKLALDTCDNGLVLAKAQQCAVQAVSNGDVAVIGYGLTANTGFYPTLEAKGIPLLHLTPTGGPQDWTSKISFSLMGDPFSFNGSIAAGLAKAGCKNTSILAYEDAAYAKYITQNAVVFKAFKAKYNVVKIPITTTDFSAAIANVQRNGADCVSLQTGGGLTPNIVRAIKATGKKLRLGMTQSNFDKNKAALGGALEGDIIGSPIAISPSLTPPKNAPALWKQYAADMKAGGLKPEQATLFSVIGYTTLQALAQALKTVPKGKVSPATTLAALNKTKYTPKGIAGTADWSKAGPFKGAPRLTNFSVYSKQIIHGKLVLRKDGAINLLNIFKKYDVDALSK